MTSTHQIKEATATLCGVTIQEIDSVRRAKSLVKARHLAMYVTKKLTHQSLPQIGRRFGGRDHTTVLNAIRRIDAELDHDPELAAQIETIIVMAKASITPETEERLDTLADHLVSRIVERIAYSHPITAAKRDPDEEGRDRIVAAAIDVVLCDRALDNAAFGRGENAARSRLDRAVKRLRANLEGRQ